MSVSRVCAPQLLINYGLLMLPRFIILGAGRPFNGEQHVALRFANGNSRVLDWMSESVAFLQAHMVFVGGYQFEQVKQHYCDYTYHYNSLWEKTGAACSLLSAELEPEVEHYVSYADILFRESLVRKMEQVDADIVVAVDSFWRKRFEGRSQDDLERCEKVNLFEQTVTRMGADLDYLFADAEYIGLARLSPLVVQRLIQQKDYYRDYLKTANLSQLIELLRQSGFTVKAVDVEGDWAELNEPKDLVHFILGTKAETLHRLQSMLTHSRIENQISFTIAEWLASEDDIVKRVQNQFQYKSLVVRSSALCEDGFAHSNAGAYKSLLNVDGLSYKSLKVAIKEVIESYPDSLKENQVLVQPMLTNVRASGVVFTRSLVRGAPYYIINYDDVTGSTESITNGSSRDHKTLVVRRDADEKSANIPVKLKSLLPALREIESLLGYDSLDIEFALTDDGLHILQVRPIAVKPSELVLPDNDYLTLLTESESHYDKLQSASPFVVGKRALFGVMTDWNPAEIIGTKPARLAMSLYRSLIMDEVWATQRAEYGYRDVRPQPLLVAFAGHPYVDIRASFNSFVPAKLDNNFSTRLVAFYLDWLEQHPHLHDKVEFDVVPTCLDLDFSRWETRLTEQGGFSSIEVKQLREALRDITIKAMERNKEDLATIKLLEQRFDQIKITELPHLEKAWLLLQDCRALGTLPFSHLARSAFVAVTLLKSAVTSGVISQEDNDDFLNTISTVSHTLTYDAEATAQKIMSWDKFVNKYGHLRPGTYDITSLSYAADPERYLRPIVARAGDLDTRVLINRGERWALARDRFAVALSEQGLACEGDALERFLRESIEGREYGKFAFTRNLSLALDEIAAWGESIGVSRELLAHITIEDILSLRTGMINISDLASWLKKRANEGKELHKLITAIELPPLIRNRDDFSVFVYPSSQANFVGSGHVIAPCVVLSLKDECAELIDKIVLIPQADPGYDWLFGRGIAGLITMYGGANSHMAIRAAEFGLPAAIGVGETQYKALTRASILELNAVNRFVRVTS